jgi:MFS family permease
LRRKRHGQDDHKGERLCRGSDQDAAVLVVVGCALLNVTAGIGVLSQASLMIREVFQSRFPNVNATDAVAAGAAFTAICSLFNIGGRFFWSSLSDYTGRKAIYMVYFLLGAMLYALIPTFGRSMGNIVLFVLGFGVIISMYGGGFATIPAYLRDMFGTMESARFTGGY